MSLETKHFYDFGDFRLDLTEKVLLRDGEFVPITPKVFETLQVFVENAGRLIEKDELMRRIWQDHFVEESNLTYNVKMLRKALGDSAAKPTFIETISKRGYRFIAEVKEIFPETEQNSPPVKTFPPTRKSSSSFAALGILLLCTLSAGSWFARKQLFSSESNAPILSAPFHSEKFSNSGKVRCAVISPDGKLVAYVNRTGEKNGVWLRRLETSDNVQLVPPSEEFYGGLAFAHDGQTLFFMRKPLGKNMMSAIYRVSIFGGVPEKVLEQTEGWFSLSPDDRQISFVRCEHKDDDFCSLIIADTDGRNERKILTRPRPFRIADNQFSPDGKSIALASGQSSNGGNDFRLTKVDVADGAESEITPQKFFDIKNVKWLPDGDHLLLTAMESLDGKSKIWQVSTATGEAQPLTKDAANFVQISFNKDASQMIATRLGNDFNLYLSTNGDTKILTAAREATFAPDGKIVYAADDGDIWIINRDGGEQRQLTNNVFKDFSPRVSPDGRRIYFTSNRTGTNQVWQMNADGSSQTQLTKTEGGYPQFVTPDGKWIYYESGLRQTIWKVSADGDEEIQISERIAYRTTFSPDGNFAAYSFRDKQNNNQIKIGVMNLDSKEQVKVFDYGDGKSHPVDIAWSSDNRTLNFITDMNAKNSLWAQSLDEDKPRFIADLGDKEIQDFALAPDGSAFAFTRGEWLHDAVLIDGLK
ncbi:MAG TPA: winged helix-turn-helix domain-containing protein [Pyrinomonadaceae bacterium]|nr:winged helix-turn-helix domain-containing protein [Pyrinomonadaceae bacterium]